MVCECAPKIGVASSIETVERNMASAGHANGSTIHVDATSDSKQQNSSQLLATQVQAAIVKRDDDLEALPHLPREILKNIVRFAMISDDGGKIAMPCLSNAPFKPGLNLSCLLLE